MDNSQAHRARILKAHAEQSKGMLTLFFLPPYSPELNPDEWVRKNVKHDDLGRALVKNESELAQFATTALAKLKEMPETSRPFFGDSVLGYERDHTAGPANLFPPSITAVLCIWFTRHREPITSAFLVSFDPALFPFRAYDLAGGRREDEIEGVIISSFFRRLITAMLSPTRGLAGEIS